jgi:long-chain acyl-CoA synthetase
LKFSLFGWSGGFAQFLTTLIIQGKPILVNNSPSEVQKHFQKTKPATIYGSPALISAFIDAAVLNGTDLSSTNQVVTMGGQISPALFVKIKQNFPGAKIINLYGSSEGGRIASKQLLNSNDGGVAGTILPEATVEIVDSLGNQLPKGATGLIRYKSLTQQYVNDPEATSLVFKDGWFYCGDLGHFDQNNNLILEGRESEVLNIGGEKLDPLLIDQFVLAQPGVVDCGTFSINTAAGRHATGIAVVAQTDFDAKSLRSSVIMQFPNAAPLAIVKAEQIPKTQMGKIMRKSLASQFQEIAAKADSE